MRILVLSIILFSACYFTLRSAKLLWEKHQLQAWTRYFLSVIAWGAVAGALGIGAGIAEPLIEIFTAPSMGIGFQIGGIALGITAILQYANANPELFDYESMKPFLKDSLFFADPSRSRTNIFEELDKHEVRRVYKEVTGKELSEGKQGTDKGLDGMLKSRLIPGKDGIVKGSTAARELIRQPIASLHLSKELQQLKTVAVVDVTESWRINALKRANHPWYGNLSRVIVDPINRRLELTLESEAFIEQQIRKPESLYRFKQDIYEFMLAVFEEPWTKPYKKHSDVIECQCIGVEVDAFRGRETKPLLKAEITLGELAAHVGRFFNAGELKTTILAE